MTAQRSIMLKSWKTLNCSKWGFSSVWLQKCLHFHYTSLKVFEIFFGRQWKPLGQIVGNEDALIINAYSHPTLHGNKLSDIWDLNFAIIMWVDSIVFIGHNKSTKQLNPLLCLILCVSFAAYLQFPHEIGNVYFVLVIYLSFTLDLNKSKCVVTVNSECNQSSKWTAHKSTISSNVSLYKQQKAVFTWHIQKIHCATNNCTK